MKLEPLMEMTAELRRPADEVGAGPLGQRSIAEVVGGRFHGPRLRGTLATPGADWILVTAGGLGLVDVRVTLKTDDGAFIYACYKGRLQFNDRALATLARGADTAFGDAYFFTQPLFETGHAGYAWLNSVVAVAEGRLTTTGVAYQVYECRH
jgi:hypothetical protein